MYRKAARLQVDGHMDPAADLARNILILWLWEKWVLQPAWPLPLRSPPQTPALCLLSRFSQTVTMGTASGPFHLPELCDQKLLEFVRNVENKDLVWLQEIEEEAVRMFTR